MGLLRRWMVTPRHCSERLTFLVSTRIDIPSGSNEEMRRQENAGGLYHFSAEACQVPDIVIDKLKQLTSEDCPPSCFTFRSDPLQVIVCLSQHSHTDLFPRSLWYISSQQTQAKCNTATSYCRCYRRWWSVRLLLNL